jgi:hypothetical protein
MRHKHITNYDCGTSAPAQWELFPHMKQPEPPAALGRAAQQAHQGRAPVFESAAAAAVSIFVRHSHRRAANVF